MLVLPNCSGTGEDAGVSGPGTDAGLEDGTVLDGSTSDSAWTGSDADLEDSASDAFEGDVETPEPDASTKNSYLFAFSKAMVANPLAQQQRGYEAVALVGSALSDTGQFTLNLLQEPVRSLDEHLANPTPFLITSEIITDALKHHAQTLAKEDTIVVYSHTHGVRSVPGSYLGGLVLDDPGTADHAEKWLTWSDYADGLLALPAKTVVVLTMSCFSGGLVNYLNNSPTARARWQDRESEGRHFVVVTSQNATALSNPRFIEGSLINPFTYAVVKAFEGEADGYRRGETTTDPDGEITIQELVEYVVDETKKHTSLQDSDNDADPQVTGSYRGDSVLVEMGD